MHDLLPVPPPLGWRARLEALLGHRPLRASHVALVSVVAVALLAAGVVASVWVLRTPPPSESLIPQAATAAVSSIPAPAPSEGTLMVQAAGAVLSPGVYRVPADARVIDVIDAAGGLAPEADADRLALAAKVSDGERVYVPGSARRCRALRPVRPSRQGLSTSTPRRARSRRTPGCRTCDGEGNRDLPREPRAVHLGRSAARGARHWPREARSAG